MGKKWDKYAVQDKKWDKYLATKETPEIKGADLGDIAIPEKSRIAYVHNNPGNLMYAKQSGAEKGESRGKGNWAKFNSPKEGFNALVDQVKLDQSRDLTVSEFMNKYAPPSENDTDSYIRSFTDKVGVKATDKLANADAMNIAKFIAQRESNTEIVEAIPEVPSVKATVPADPIPDEELSTWDKIQNSVENAVGQTKAARYDISQALNIPLSYGDKGIEYLGNKLGLEEETTNRIRQEWQKRTSFGPGSMGPLGLIDPSTQSALRNIELLFLDKDEREEAIKGQVYPEKLAEQAEKASGARGEPKETGSILTGIKEGDAGEIAAGTVDGMLGFVPSLIVGLTTGGTGFVPWVTGMELNESVKAEANMTDKQIEDVFNEGDENIGTSLFVGVATGMLEKYGFSKLTKYLKTKEISKSFAQRFKTLMTETGRQGVINWLEAGLSHYSKSYTELDAGTEDKSIESKIQNQEEAAKSGAEFLVSEEGIDAGIKAMAGSFGLGVGKNVGRTFTPKDNAKIQKVEIADGKTSAMIESGDGAMILKDKLSKEDADAAQKHLSKKYPSSEFEVIGVVDKKGDFVEGKYTVEQRSLEEAEQKLAETDKKKVEDEKKLAEKETLKSELEDIEIQKKTKSSQKEKETLKSGLQKKKLPETKEPEKIKQDGKQRDDGTPTKKELPKEKLQEKPGAVQQPKKQVTKEGKKETKADRKGEPETKKIVVENGKIKKKADFLSDVEDSVTKKIVKQKTDKLIREKQKKLDEEVAAIDKTIEKIDKEGISVDHAVKGDVEKRYMVKKKADGSFSVTSMHDRDAKQRPVRVTNQKLKTDILKKYRKQRAADVEKIKPEKIKEISDRHSKEIEAEITKYKSERKKAIETEPKKPTGKEKPAEPVKRKKQPKPSAGKKVTVDEAAALRDQIRLEARSALAAARSTKKEVTTDFKDTTDSITEKLKEGEAKEFVTPSQYKSIVSKLGKAKTRRQKEIALEYVDKVLGGAESKKETKVTTKAIGKILNKKRTKPVRGAKKMKTNRPLTDKEGEVKFDDSGKALTQKIGVDTDVYSYFEQAKEHFKRLVSLTKKGDVEKKLAEGEELSDSQLRKLDKAVEIKKEISKERDEALQAIAENKDKEAVRKAELYLQMIEDFGDISNLNNEKLKNILNTLSERETKGVEKLNETVAKDIKRYQELGEIVKEATAPYDMASKEFQEKQTRRRDFDAKKQQSLSDNKSFSNKAKWFYRDTKLKLKEKKEKALLDVIITPNIHLETTTQLLDRSKDQKLSKFITEEIAARESEKLDRISRSSNQVFGKILELSGDKEIKKLIKEHGDKDDLITWLHDNKKFTPKIQRAIMQGVNDKLYELETSFTDKIKWKDKQARNQELKLNEALKVYAWSKNEATAKELAKMGFTREVINDKIVSKLPKWAKEWADWIAEEYAPQNYNESNDVFMRNNRVPLSRVENYTVPIERYNLKQDEILGRPFVAESVSDMAYSHLKERVQTTKNPLKIIETGNEAASGFSDLLFKHIQNSEHYKAWARTAKEMDVILNHPDFKDAAQSAGLEKVIKHQIDVNINGAEKLVNDYANTIMGKLLSKYAGVQLAAKVNMIPKQATSFINGIVDAKNPTKWVTDSMKLMINPKEASRLWKELYSNSPKFKERVDNMMLSDPDLRGGMHTFGPKKDPNWKKITNKMLNGWIPIGDQAGILYGYGAIYKDVLKRTGSKEKAIQAFERYEGTQQSRSPLYLTSVQMQKNSMSRLMLMFKSMPQLLFNKSFQALTGMKRDIKSGGGVFRGGLKNVKMKDVRKFVVNHFVTNTLFQMVAYAPYAMLSDSDDTEYWKKVRRAAITGSFNGLFVLGDIIDWTVGKAVAGEKYPLRITRSVEDIFRKPIDQAFKGEKSRDLKEIMHAISAFALYMKGVPLHTLETTFKGFAEIGNGDVTTGFLRAMGFTDYTVEEAATLGKAKEDDGKDAYSSLRNDIEEKEEDAKKAWHWGEEEKEETKDKYKSLRK